MAKQPISLNALNIRPTSEPEPRPDTPAGAPQNAARVREVPAAATPAVLPAQARGVSYLRTPPIIEPRDDIRVLTTVRLESHLSEGLRELMYRTRRQKQDLISEAVAELLAKHGIQ